MGLMDDLAATRVHVLVVGVPGYPLLRLRASAAVRRRGWVAASSPADADVVLVCGRADEALRAAVDAAWTEVPAPRARRTAPDAAAIEGLLDSAVRVLGDRWLQAASSSGHGPAEPVAAGARRLGPVLPDWPAGLVVDCEVRDGAVVEASVTPGVPVAREDDPLAPDETAFVQACDRAARLLRLAGWQAEARRLDRCIDQVLAGEGAAARLPDVRRTAARAARSALLRAGLDRAPGEALHRLLVILGDAERSALGEPGVDDPVDPAGLADALRGVDVRQVRLLVAIAGTDPVAGPPAEEVLDEHPAGSSAAGDPDAAAAPGIPWAWAEPDDEDEDDREAVSPLVEVRSGAEPRDHPAIRRAPVDGTDPDA